MNERQCPLCQDRRGKRWTEALSKGRKTIREAAAAFGMSKEDIEEHLYKHQPSWTNEPSSVVETSDREFYIRRLAQMGEDLHELLDDVIDFGSTTPDTIKSATTLTREIRETLRLLGEITKVLKSEEEREALMAAEEMKQHCMGLSNIIVTLACPSCREKIIGAIQDQKRMMLK
jgi:hypothetical protein